MNAQPIEKPFSVASLAARWDCGEAVVRKMIRDGRLASFRLGTLIRVSAAEVRRYESQDESDQPPGGVDGDVVRRAVELRSGGPGVRLKQALKG